jgi:hypothetical protein
MVRSRGAAGPRHGRSSRVGGSFHRRPVLTTPGRACATLVAILALALPLAAGEAQDRVFATGVLDAIPEGQSILFEHARSGTFDPAAVPLIEDGEMVVEIDTSDAGMRQAIVTLREAGPPRRLDPMPAGAGHPLLLIFLETTARNVSALTGGSPFYIRNRMREALGTEGVAEPVEIALDGGAAEAERLVFRPFAEDPNRERLGDLADLELRITVSGAVPGGFERLEAVAAPDPGVAPAYSEVIAFLRAEGP